MSGRARPAAAAKVAAGKGGHALAAKASKVASKAATKVAAKPRPSARGEAERLLLPPPPGAAAAGRAGGGGGSGGGGFASGSPAVPPRVAAAAAAAPLHRLVVAILALSLIVRLLCGMAARIRTRHGRGGAGAGADGASNAASLAANFVAGRQLERLRVGLLRSLPTQQWAGGTSGGGGGEGSGGGSGGGGGEGGGDECSLCLEPFAVGETVRRLPCCHVFHKRCGLMTRMHRATATKVAASSTRVAAGLPRLRTAYILRIYCVFDAIHPRPHARPPPPPSPSPGASTVGCLSHSAMASARALSARRTHSRPSKRPSTHRSARQEAVRPLPARPLPARCAAARGSPRMRRPPLH